MRRIIFGIFAVFFFGTVFAEEIFRFPIPEFTSGYVLKKIVQFAPRGGLWVLADCFALILALSLAAYLALKRRSRKGLFLLALCSLLYFGFIRRGCVCSVGSLQNVVLSLADSSYALPLGVALFFVLPLVFALYFGRVFCASVCPLGAAQELALVRPMLIPKWLGEVLGLLAYLYLFFAILMVVMGAGFIICRYDPFVSLFRMNGGYEQLALTAAVLIVCMFVGRAYCRFICPYGVLLRFASLLSRRRVTITPDECVKCGLCRDACPFGAINSPSSGKVGKEYSPEKKKFVLSIVALPLLVIIGAYIGYRSGDSVAQMHPVIAKAGALRTWEDSGRGETKDMYIKAYLAEGSDTKRLFALADVLIGRFRIGMSIVLGLFAFVAGLRLLHLSIYRKQVDYVADSGNCFACGRCFISCPVERKRLVDLKGGGPRG